MGITEIGAAYGCQGSLGTKREAEKASAEGKTAGEKLTREEMFERIAERTQEIYEKIKNNDTEPSFQIGSQSFTVREWDKLLERFDAVQKETREKMRQEQEKRQKEAIIKEQRKKEITE